ncbi:MAG TPA: hypothetical protein VFN89_12800 [Solirubrobacterales bacterium]|nr:hypothetical protein [Solirubrobacterales bacterium]
MIEKLKQASPRRVAAIAAFVIVLGVAVWMMAAGTFLAGLALLIAATGLLLELLQQFLPNRPKLHVGPRGGASELHARPEKPVRPLDREAIAGAQGDLCRKEMPRMPAPSFPPGSPLIAPLAGFQASQRLTDAITGISDDHLRKFLSKVANYEAGLEDWLDRLDAARAEQARVFESELRISELGQAAADHVHLRLRFPEGFDLDGEPPEVGPPPIPPTLHPRMTADALGRIRADMPVRPVGIRLPGTDKPTYSIEGGKVKVDWDLGRLNQSDHRDVPAFRLKAAPPGTYEIEWEATSAGLSKPMRGTVKIRIEKAAVGDAVEDLKDAEAEHRAYELG